MSQLSRSKCLIDLFSWKSCVSLPPSRWFRLYLLQRWLTVMNGRKCSGEQVEAVSGEPAEARRLAPPDCFALRLRDLALPPCPAYIAAACTSFILGLRRPRFHRSTRAVPRGRVRRRRGRRSEPWPAISSCILTLRRSSLSIRVLVPNTQFRGAHPESTDPHSLSFDPFARPRECYRRWYTPRARDCPSFIYLPLQAARVYGFYWVPSRHVTCAAYSWHCAPLI